MFLNNYFIWYDNLVLWFHNNWISRRAITRTLFIAVICAIFFEHKFDPNYGGMTGFYIVVAFLGFMQMVDEFAQDRNVDHYNRLKIDARTGGFTIGVMALSAVFIAQSLMILAWRLDPRSLFDVLGWIAIVLHHGFSMSLVPTEPPEPKRKLVLQ